MITPASVADWAMFAGVLGALSGLGVLGYRSIFQGSFAATDEGFGSAATPDQRAA